MRKDWHPKLKDWTRRCLFAAEIAVAAYIADVKTNIRGMVQGIVDEERASDDIDDHHTARDRIGYLSSWSTAEFPLGFGEKVYPALLRAITPAGAAPTLVLSNKKSLSTLELATVICRILQPTRPLPLQAPLIPKSRSLAIFRVVIPYMTNQASYNGAPDPDGFVKYALAQILDDNQVAHVPWCAPHQGDVGRPARKVDFHFWRRTSKAQEVGDRALLKVLDAQEHADATDALRTAQAALRDAKAPWAIHPMTVGELPTVLLKVALPADFYIADASLSSEDGYISQVYQWMETHYDGANPIHLFALFVAHIFSRMAPNLGHPPMPSSVRSMKGNSSAITAAVRKSPWTFDSRRGVTASEPFIVMLSTFIIAMVDESSPLRKHLKDHNSLGVWSNKHGKPSLFLMALAWRLNFRLRAGSKLMNAFNLVRIGVADAHAPAIYKSPKYGRNDSWTIKPAHEVMSLARRFLALMKGTPYGPYEATRLIFGTDAADALGSDSFSGTAQYSTPRPIQVIPAKRARTPTSDSETRLIPVINQPESTRAQKVRRTR